MGGERIRSRRCASTCSADMEGVAGVCRWAQVSHDGALYQEGRRLYTQEINAAVRGAFNAGALEVVVMDCHGAGGDLSFNSLLPEDLDPRCEWVVQNEWTEYTGRARRRLRRRRADRHARQGRHAGRRPLAHGVRPRLAGPAVQRRLGRRDRHQRRAVRALRHADRARLGRPGDVRGGARAARRRPRGGRHQGRPRPLLGPDAAAVGGARAHRARACTRR